MKKTILTLLLFTAGLSYGQDFYNFTTSQATYADLAAPTSLTNGEVWDYDEFGPIAIPFAFSINGQAVNRFLFDDDNFLFLTPNADLNEYTGLFYSYVSGAYIQDRTVSTGSSSSSINYKTEGEAGNRIFKLEVKNAGLEEATYFDYSEDQFYVSFQIWLYESDNAIEYRYGNHNVTDLALLYDEVLVGFDSDETVSVLDGDSAQPTYVEFSIDNPPGDEFAPTLNAFPATGTVYRFAPASTAGVKAFSKNAFVLYPNPAEANLHIIKTNGEANYEVYTLLGSKVLSGTVTAANTVINVENLNKGIYLVKIGDAVQKFIKK